MFEKYPDMLTVTDLCDALRIGRNSAYKLINNDEIKSFKIGKKHLIPKLGLLDYINSQ